MDLGLNEIQQMLKNSAQEFLSRECPLTLVRAMEEGLASGRVSKEAVGETLRPS